MTGTEVQWLISVGVGVITGAATAGVSLGMFKGRVNTRLDDVEKGLESQCAEFSDYTKQHDAADVQYRMQCHSELMREIRALRAETRSSFDALTISLLQAAQTGGRRSGDK